MRPESLRGSANVVFDQESTQDRENPSVISSINHRDHIEVHEFKEYGHNMLTKNLDTIQSRPEVGLVELPENDELKSDRITPAKDRFSTSGISKSMGNVDNTNSNSQNR